MANRRKEAKVRWITFVMAIACLAGFALSGWLLYEKGAFRTANPSYSQNYIQVLDLLKSFLVENGQPAASSLELNAWARKRSESVPVEVKIISVRFNQVSRTAEYRVIIGGREYDKLIIRGDLQDSLPESPR